jgi:hypothetical protein
VRATLLASVFALFATAAVAQDGPPDYSDMPAAPTPAGGSGEWMLLQYFYPGPTLGRGVDYWISAGDYGSGPDAEGVVRVRIIQPRSFNAAAAPSEIADYQIDVDCVNRRERPVDNGTVGEWQTLPDFVPGSQTIFALCSPEGMAGRPREPDIAAAVARSSELERLHRDKQARGHY